MTNKKPVAQIRDDYKKPDFKIPTVDLTFDLDKNATRVTSKMEIVKDNSAATDLVLDAENMKILGVKIDGRKLGKSEFSYDDKDHKLTIKNMPDSATIEIINEIDPEANKALSGVYHSGGMLCTQCESAGFRRITPFLDRPDNLSVFTVTLNTREGSKYPVLLSNGNLSAASAEADGSRSATWHDPKPKPSYLFALVAGDLAKIDDNFVTKSGNDVALAIYTDKGNEDRLDHAMVSLKKSMKWDEEKYGREYDLSGFNVVAVNDFNMGAMENTSLNIFNSKFVLAKPETATDADYLGIERVIAHEYFHHWTGNRVTVRNWFELSLKEGLTVYREHEFSADMNSRAVKRIEDVESLRAFQFPEDAGPTAQPVYPKSYISIDNLYTMTTYEKGAEVIRMLANMLGEKTYRKGTDLYFDRHEGEAVTINEWLAAMEDASGRDLTQFRRWYDQAGTPELEAKTSYDAATKIFKLELSQSNPKGGKPAVIPVNLALLAPDGSEMPLTLKGETKKGAKNRVIELTKKKQVFEFKDLDFAPVPSILRGFSAPVNLKTDLTDAELRFLMAKDTDLFNRREAGHRLMGRALMSLVKDHKKGKVLKLDTSLRDAIGALLDDPSIDKAFAATALSLPSEGEMAQMMKVVDVDAIHAAHSAMSKEIGSQLKAKFETTYRAQSSRGAYKPTTKEIGRRALRSRCLSYMVDSGDRDAIRTAKRQYDNANNMTDSFAALSSLCKTSSPSKDEALNHFYDTHKDDPLVIDKWFAVQAGASGVKASDIKQLLRHPAADIQNPNRLRSIMGVFIGNATGFHAADGSGYKLVSETAKKVDAFNPQAAAGLMRGFRTIANFDVARQNLMQEELQKLRSSKGVSENVYELAKKCLEDPRLKTAKKDKKDADADMAPPVC